MFISYVFGPNHDQVCSGDFDSPEIMNTADDLALSKLSLHPDSSSEATSSELDQFMVLFFFSPCQNIFTQQKTTFHVLLFFPLQINLTFKYSKFILPRKKQ